MAKYLNDMIRPYINSTYSVESSTESLLKTESLVMTIAQKIVSVDVPSLFTDVPIDRTFDIILKKAFYPPSILHLIY